MRPRTGSDGRARLAAAILVAYARVRWLLFARRDLRRTVQALRDRRAPAPAPLDRREAIRLTHAVVRVLRLLPTDSRCLVRSLVVLAVLAERGSEVELVIGVLPGATFAAHAWVELDGAPLLAAGVAGDGRLVEL
ncbi:MAG TPA: lasso peptide biosynthesis B2 protein [Solirubrobacterales bacterium]|nr:lasso peptide biosynthesis B2 protein [Solirubrobacterales bacterium]